ncbi:hypothetical protein KIV56_10810 [Cryobacterium breve]|uniref:Uncharacterized protein n=1 Tax=Cryobacterium breve TaxID=1259258 RepID=A0ABY7N990_9MICO|nr:hypothetical protein [Cryobacterium breve]WBM79031.1 hypothetical protein KIV56_10810 [Cryobacterium breve]
MFCIAAFIVLLFMAAISARYRKYLAKAWNCTFRRITFRPCDTTFKQDMKDHMLAPIAARRPGLVKPASIGLEVVAVLIILTTIWSGYEVVKSGVNLYVYGTCNKQDSASCSLGAEACSIPDQTPGFGDSLAAWDVVGAFGNEFASLGETFSAIPSRMQNWDATAYLPADATYLNPYDASKKTALEVIDPGCTYCLQLFNNIEKAGFGEKQNLSYISYPIQSATGYKFKNSLLVTEQARGPAPQPARGRDHSGRLGDPEAHLHREERRRRVLAGLDQQHGLRGRERAAAGLGARIRAQPGAGRPRGPGSGIRPGHADHRSQQEDSRGEHSHREDPDDHLRRPSPRRPRLGRRPGLARSCAEVSHIDVKSHREHRYATLHGC